MLLGVALQLVVDEVEDVVLVVGSEEDTELRILVSDGKSVAGETLEKFESDRYPLDKIEPNSNICE